MKFKQVKNFRLDRRACMHLKPGLSRGINWCPLGYLRNTLEDVRYCTFWASWLLREYIMYIIVLFHFISFWDGTRHIPLFWRGGALPLQALPKPDSLLELLAPAIRATFHPVAVRSKMKQGDKKIIFAKLVFYFNLRFSIGARNWTNNATY